MCSMQNVGTVIQQPQQAKIKNNTQQPQQRTIQVPSQQINGTESDKFVRQSEPQRAPVTRQPMSPQQYRLLQEMNNKKQKSKSSSESKNALTWALGIASSAVILLYFGKTLYKDYMDGRKIKQIEKMMAESANLADDLVKQIKECKDEVLKKAAANEYQKGDHMRSEKRIKDIQILISLCIKKRIKKPVILDMRLV